MTKWWTVLITIALLAGIKIWNPDPVKSLRYIQYDFFQQEQEQVVLVLVPQLYFLELVILKILQTGQEQLIQLLNVM